MSLGIVSCNEKIFTDDVDCNTCSLDKPYIAGVAINVSVDYRFNAVPLTIYEGDLEDKKVVLRDTFYLPVDTVFLRVGKKYTVEAIYKWNNKTFHALNAAKPKVLTVSDACDETCYVLSNNKIDVRLKKEFLNY
jgi:hypothetical protein